MKYCFKKIYHTPYNIELHYTKGLKKVFTHTHDFYEFSIALCDGTINQIDDKNIVLNTYDCLFVRPENVHMLLRLNDGEEVDTLNISVQKDYFEDCWQILYGNREITLSQTPLRLSARRIAEYQHLCLDFDNDQMDEQTLRYFEKKFVFEILFLYNRTHNENNDSDEMIPKWLETVLNYFKDSNNYIKNNNLDDIYKLSGYSKPQFNKLFKKYTNKTPIQYYNNCKIEAARMLLIESNLSIAQITYRLGFNSTAHFIHLFKRQIGTSPLQYRKKYAGE